MSTTANIFVLFVILDLKACGYDKSEGRSNLNAFMVIRARPIRLSYKRVHTKRYVRVSVIGISICVMCIYVHFTQACAHILHFTNS